MLLSYTVPNCYPPFDSIPDVMDRYTANVMVDNVPVCMSLSDTNGCCSADVIRSYSGGNSCPEVFIILFSVDSPPSFENEQNTLGGNEN
ncbi:hypothetical protein Pelo_19842 [Pelomyxa schiedti]|nr:hypothetical protein Pelo_19842 [Pelomyxa schiedti]